MNIKMLNIFIILFTTVLYYRPLYCKPLDINDKDHNIYHDDTGIDEGYNGNLDKKTIEQLRKCDMDMETMELCMRCAKITKSTIVYPLCCANEDNIKGWCHDYVFFGTL